MEITYLGHSCFKLKGKNGTLIMDPYDDYIGLNLPSASADVVTISHDHKDHNADHRVKGTSRREKPFVINKPGAYEVGGISVFGIPAFHDDSAGTERGENNIYVVLLDDLRICHLGDLGHDLASQQVSAIGAIDILICPVGGHFTINSKQAIKIIKSLDPAFAIPMHYKTDRHNADVFAEVSELDIFLKEYGVNPAPEPSLKAEKTRLPEETELVVLVD
ncbi:MAG: MBL fold metallo-hydrolase [Patescibacteria group bacterium]